MMALRTGVVRHWQNDATTGVSNQQGQESSHGWSSSLSTSMGISMDAGTAGVSYGTEISVSSKPCDYKAGQTLSATQSTQMAVELECEIGGSYMAQIWEFCRLPPQYDGETLAFPMPYHARRQLEETPVCSPHVAEVQKATNSVRATVAWTRVAASGDSSWKL
jgi:hypothetical protein